MEIEDALMLSLSGLARASQPLDKETQMAKSEQLI
jgi:hypothetical protein